MKKIDKKRAETIETETPAPASAAAPGPHVPERLERIPLGILIPSPNNPRKIPPNDPAIAELAASIKANGLLQPGVARPSAREGYYELLAGARRYEAHKLLRAVDMLCIVREMTDQAALECTVLENLQRSDLSPLEEASGVQALLGHGHTAEDIAIEIGKTAAWVARRARLTELIPETRKALLSHESTIQQMLAVAALPAAEQKRLISEGGNNWLFDPDRTRDLIAHIQRRQQKLAAAPFPVDLSFQGGRVPACTTCQKRTGCNPLLFGDDQEPAKDDRCLDLSCWEGKLKVFLDRQLEEAKRDHPGLILVTTESGGGQETEKLLNVGNDSWDAAKSVKAGTPGARPAFVVFGPKTGKVIHVLVKREAGGKVDRAARPKGTDGKPVPPKPHERQLTLHQKRCAWMVNTFVESVAGNLGDLYEKLGPGKQLTVLMAFGCAHNTGSDGACGYSSASLGDAWKTYAAVGGDKGPVAGKLEEFYPDHVAPVFKGRVRFNVLDQAEAAFVEACRLCRLLGYALFAKHHEACMKDLPVPRSWGSQVVDPWGWKGVIADPYEAKHEQPRVFAATEEAKNKTRRTER